MTTEDKFNAAVNVIRSLPKNGSYQPSNELMLRFYAYYKQATEGPCSEAGTSKPAFWDVIGRAKHTAWARLKNMSREEAMQRYVDELHSIVETMSYTDNVATFMQAGDQEILDQLPMDDLELIAGDCLKYVRSQPGSPLASRPSTPDPRMNGTSSPSPPPPAQPESDDEEFIDTMENEPESIKSDPEILTVKQHSLTNGIPAKIEQPPIVIPNGVVNRDSKPVDSLKTKHTVDISTEIARTVAALQTDVRALDARLTILEQAAQKSLKSRQKITIYHLSPALIAFILIWPFVAIRFTNRLSSRNK